MCCPHFITRVTDTRKHNHENHNFSVPFLANKTQTSIELGGKLNAKLFRPANDVVTVVVVIAAWRTLHSRTVCKRTNTFSSVRFVKMVFSSVARIQRILFQISSKHNGRKDLISHYEQMFCISAWKIGRATGFCLARQNEHSEKLQKTIGRKTMRRRVRSPPFVYPGWCLFAHESVCVQNLSTFFNWHSSGHCFHTRAHARIHTLQNANCIVS